MDGWMDGWMDGREREIERESNKHYSDPLHKRKKQKKIKNKQFIKLHSERTRRTIP
jgi:hypothetical protein